MLPPAARGNTQRIAVFHKENVSHITFIDITETGLRPGEKLYEELLLKTETLDKTPNELIFIERDRPHSLKEVEAKLELLKEAIDSGDDGKVMDVLKKIVPEYKAPEEINERTEEPAGDGGVE